MGLTFKENCPDLRNTRVIDVVRALEEYGLTVDVHDPHADAVEARGEYGVELVQDPDAGAYDASCLLLPMMSSAAWARGRSVVLGAQV